jgi:hypothetical protein
LEISGISGISAAHLAVPDEPTAVRVRRNGSGPDRGAPVKESLLMNIIPILCRRRSAAISHNIAQERQAKDVQDGCTSG